MATNCLTYFHPFGLQNCSVTSYVANASVKTVINIFNLNHGKGIMFPLKLMRRWMRYD